MFCPFSLTPSLSQALDDLRGDSSSNVGAEYRAPAQVRFGTDLLGMAIFFVMLGTYLTARI